MADAVRFLGDLVAVLWIALAIAVVVFIVAALALILSPVGRRIEAWMLPRLTRLVRVLHGVSPDARPWGCRPCGSVNVASAAACYRCGTLRPADAGALPEAATDPGIHLPQVPMSSIDNARSPGPGAAPPLPPPPGEPPSRRVR